MEEAVLAGELDTLSLETAEDELIDDYLLGSITPEEKCCFEEQFLITDERRQKLKFASALIEYAHRTSVEDDSAEQKTAQKPPPRARTRVLLSWKHIAFIAVAASVLLAVLAGRELTKLRQQNEVAQETRSELTRLQAALAADNRKPAQVVEPSNGPVRNAEDAVNQIPLIEFTTATRTVVPPKFRIPAAAQFARIDWNISGPIAEKYREVLLSETGRQLWTQEFPSALLSPAKRSTIVLPASILVPGNYHLRLDKGTTGGQFEEAADYVFRVVRE